LLLGYSPKTSFKIFRGLTPPRGDENASLSLIAVSRVQKHCAFFANQAGCAMLAFDVFKTQVAALGSTKACTHAFFAAENQPASEAEGEMLCRERQGALAAGADVANFDFREFTGLRCGRHGHGKPPLACS
jgi:hypothetical protein